MRDRYTITERLDHGGMAEVFRGVAESMEGFKKSVAIKRILPNLTKNQKFVSMFLDEARLSLFLQHANIVQVFDISKTPDNAYFLVMEYVDGCNLKGLIERQRQKGKKIEIAHTIYMMIECCKALQYAHQLEHPETNEPLGIVHRDISPPNILLSKNGEVKLVDFGLAKASSHLNAEDEDMVKGKFGYLAPEVTMGQRPDKRVDIFAAGILLWEMLAGRRLFLGDTDVETFKLVRAAAIPDPRQFRPDIPDEVLTVLGKALAKDPAQRYQSGNDFARDLGLVLRKLSRPVTYLDIAEVVRLAADERARRRKAEGKTQAGDIGDLVLDALHQFSGSPGSVASEAIRATLGTPGIEAGGGGFEDPSAWGLDAVFEEAARSVPEPEAIEVEPDEPDAPAPPPRPQAPARPAAPARAAAPAAAPPAAPTEGAAPAARPRVQDDAPKKEGPFWRRWFGN